MKKGKENVFIPQPETDALDTPVYLEELVASKDVKLISKGDKSITVEVKGRRGIHCLPIISYASGDVVKMPGYGEVRLN